MTRWVWRGALPALGLLALGPMGAPDARAQRELPELTSRAMRATRVTAEQVRIELGEARELTQALQVKPTRGDARSLLEVSGKAFVDVKPAEPTFIQPKDVEKLQVSNEKTYSAGRLLHVSPVPGGGEARVEAWRLFLRTENDPITWRDSDAAYATNLVVGVDPDEGQPGALPQTVTVRFFTEGAGVDVDPPVVQIRQGGAAGYVATRVRVADHTVSPRVHAEADFGAQEWSFAVRPRVKRLEVVASPRRIPGFGLGTTTLRVRRYAEDGAEFADDSLLTVDLVVERGVLDPIVTIPALASEVSATLRSTGVGAIDVAANAAGLRSEPVRVEFVWPWLLMAISLGMGAVGGRLRAAQESREAEDAARPPRGRSLVAAAIGGFTGLIFVAASATGLASFEFPTPIVVTEAGAAVVAGLAGYTGSWGLSRLSAALGFQRS